MGTIVFSENLSDCLFRESRMNKPDSTLEIQTLGRFSILVNGKPVATDWPDETVKVLFCSLLSPLDLYVTWDRICRSMWGVPATRASRRRLEEIFSRHLNSFLIKELDFNPLITSQDGIRIDQQRIHVDAYEFHSTAVEGLRLLSRGNRAAASEQFSRAKSLYGGIYLPGINGKIIENTRNDLESLYLNAILEAMPLTRNSWYSGYNRRAEPGLHVKAAQGRFKR
jgi:two-component SAPR family response regulator